MLTPEEIAKVRAQAGAPPIESVSSGPSAPSLSEKLGLSMPSTSEQPKIGGLVGDVAGALQKRGENVIKAGEQTRQDVANAGGGIFANVAGIGQMAGRVAGQVAGGALDIVGEGIKKGLDVVAPGGSQGVADRFAEQTNAIKDQKNVFGETNAETLAKIHDTIQKIPLPDNVKQGFGDLFSTLGLTGAGKFLETPVETIPSKIANATEKVVNQATKTTSAVTDTASNLRDAVQNYRKTVTPSNLDPRLAESANRVRDLTPPGGVGAAIQPKLSERYTKYYDQSVKATKDIKQDPAISQVGSTIGDEFKKVVALRRQAGQTMADELKRVGGTKTNISEPVNSFESDLAENGLSRGADGKLAGSDLSKMNEADRGLLDVYATELDKLGTDPSVAQIDAMVSRVSSDLDLYKSKNGITGSTNGERIIKKNLDALRSSIDADKTKNPELKKYSAAKAAYSQLSGFIDEGSKYLGKVTQSGDFQKDASIAKSAVQSILNNGKKDWLQKLEDITGYPALDESVLALQAMKDAGDFRGLSLLQTLAGGETPTIPTSKGAILQRILNFGVTKGTEAVMGKPNERTLKFLQDLEKEQRNPKKIEGGGPNTQSLETSKDYKEFPRQSGLSTTDKAVEDASIKKYLSDKPGLLEEYKKQFGSVVNTDLARRLFKDVGYNGGNSAAVQEASSALAKDAWRDALKTTPEKDVYIFAGGSGVGKSSVVEKFLPRINDQTAVLDGNLSKLSSAQARIKEAIAAGKTPNIVYVYRDPVDAWVNGVVKRMNTNATEGGRIVPMSTFLENHPGSLDVVKKLIADNKRLSVRIFDNSLGRGNETIMSVDKLNKLSYNEKELKARLLIETKRLLKENVITKKQYEQLIK